MAVIKLTGGKTLGVTEDKANKVLGWIKDTKIDRGRMVDLGLENYIKLSQIVGVDFQTTPLGGAYNEQKEKQAQQEKEWKDYIEECKAETIDKKTERTMKSFVNLIWTARGNKGTIDKDVEEKVFNAVLEYFNDNPKEWHCKSEVYKSYIPHNQEGIMVSKVKGAKTIGELAFDRIEANY